MTSSLMKSVSGIRGIVGESITPALIAAVGSAFAQFCKRGTIVLGRDTRTSGYAIEKGLESALLLSGSSVINIGVVPTPTVQIMVEHLKADGGIVISASHNPIEWNAFKLIGRTGTFLNGRETEQLFKLMDNDFTYAGWDHIGTLKYEMGADDIHIQKILSVIDTDAIRKRRLKTAVDSVNGAGSSITVKFLNELGCGTIPVYCEPTGIFPRGAEPVAENLSDLARTVLSEGADVGFAQDPDADRLAIVDELGRPIGEENTIALVAEHLLSKNAGRVVVNLSTTKAVDDIAQRHGVAIARTKVGEIHVVEEMLRMGARIGGEGSGGIISPEVHLGRDSLAGIGYILEMMTERNKKISELVLELPQYSMKKGSIRLIGKGAKISHLSKLKKDYSSQKISEIDGLRIEFLPGSEFYGGWVHLRPSNTEPIFRIIAEGRDAIQAGKIFSHFEKLLK